MSPLSKPSAWSGRRSSQRNPCRNAESCTVSFSFPSRCWSSQHKNTQHLSSALHVNALTKHESFAGSRPAGTLQSKSLEKNRHVDLFIEKVRQYLWSALHVNALTKAYKASYYCPKTEQTTAQKSLVQYRQVATNNLYSGTIIFRVRPRTFSSFPNQKPSLNARSSNRPPRPGWRSNIRACFHPDPATSGHVGSLRLRLQTTNLRLLLMHSHFPLPTIPETLNSKFGFYGARTWV